MPQESSDQFNYHALKMQVIGLRKTLGELLILSYEASIPRDSLIPKIENLKIQIEAINALANSEKH